MGKKSIGILGGMGPMATADLMIKILNNTKADRDQDHIRIFVDSNTRIPDRTAAILDHGESPLPEMTAALRNLEKLGPDGILMPCNTAHYYHEDLQRLTDIPILHMPEITARRCRELFPGKKAAILATSGTVKSGIYHRALEKEHVDYMTPDEKAQGRLMHLIYDVVKASLPLESAAEAWSSLLDGLRAEGADYFILGCTELPILADALADAGPFIDPTQELARAAVLFCGYEIKE